MLKRILMSLFMVLLIISNVQPVLATESSNNFSEDFEKYVTKESPIPKVFSKSSMGTWQQETKNYLENFHRQNVKKIIEDEEKVTFYYEVDPNIFTEQIVLTEYYKNESFAKSSTGDTKIDVYTNWSNGAKPQSVDAATASNILAATAIAIGLIPGIHVALSTLASAVAAYAGWVIDSTLPIKAETRAAVKYYKKVGSYFLSIGVWWPSVQIGRAEYWCYRTVYQPTYSGGPWIPHHYDNIPNSSESDYDYSDYRPHYYDHTWITNKVLELSNTGYYYIDIYG